jgi:polysaccharide deacetylase family sporulation protein PdaB
MDEKLDEKQKEKLKYFVKTGIVVLSFLVVIGLGIKYIPKVVTVTNSANSRKLPIYCVDEDENKVALSFDAAWGNEDTAEILDILAKYDIKVTFFMTGGWVEKFPEDVKAIAAAGHDLGNHSENHKHMSQISKEKSIDEIMKVHNKVKELTGIEMSLFRPPYGDFNNTLIDATKEAGYHCIQWDVDSLDWKDYGVDSIINSVVNNKHLGNGSIILCHNGAKYIKDALEPMIKGLLDKGYKIVPISELIYTGDYYMDHEGRQFEKK